MPIDSPPFALGCIAAAAAWLATAGVSSADWPQFRGANRDGVSRVEGAPLLAEVPAEGLEILWRVAVGSGHSGVAVQGGRVLAFHRMDAEAVLQALDFGSGEVIWETRYPCAYRDDFGFDDGPRATPTIDGDSVFTYGVEGMLHRFDLETGAVIWSRDLEPELSAGKGFFGRACSPLVVGDTVVLHVGGKTKQGKGAGLVGLSREDGSLRWAATDHEAGYASPILLGDSVFSLTREGVVILDPSDGAIRCEEPFRSTMHASVNAASPVDCGQGRVFTTSCYGVGAALWQVQEGKKAWTLNPVWREEGRLDAHYATPVYHDGFLYGFHGRQERGTELRCVRAGDGEVMWAEANLGAGSLLLAGEDLVAVTENGELLIIPARPEKVEIRIREQILRRGHRTPPAMAEGVLFARDAGELVAVRLAKVR